MMMTSVKSDDFGSEGSGEGDFSHRQACLVTIPVVFGGMCWTPVVTTRTSAKGAASTKWWVVAMLFGGDWCSGISQSGLYRRYMLPLAVLTVSNACQRLRVSHLGGPEIHLKILL